MATAVEAWKTDGYTNGDIEAWKLYASIQKKNLSGYNMFLREKINSAKKSKTWNKLKNCKIYDIAGNRFTVDIDVESDLFGVLYLGTSKFSMLKEFEGTFSVNKYSFTVKGIEKKTKYYFYIKNTADNEMARTGIYKVKTSEEVIPIVIEMGNEAIYRPGAVSPNNDIIYINRDNPANEYGKINKVEIYTNYNTMTNSIVATVYEVTPNHFSTRDYQAIGDVTAGGKRTFDVDLNVVEGDYIAVGCDYGRGPNLDVSGGNGKWASIDKGLTLPITNEDFGAPNTVQIISLYGLGETEE